MKSCFVNVFLSTDQDECGCGSQRGEPKHPSDEQSRDLADLRTWCWCASHRAPEHTLLQRARGVDSNKCHSQLSKFSFLSCCVSAAIWASETNQAVQGFFYIEKGCLDGAKRSNKKYDWGGEKNAIQCFELHCINWNMTSLTSSCCISHRRWTSQLNCSGLVMIFSLFTLQMSCRKCSELQPRLTWWVEQ